MSDNDRDERPQPKYGEFAEKKPKRPEFGEYATPEQQRAAIRVPTSDVNESVPIAKHDDNTHASHKEHQAPENAHSHPTPDTRRSDAPADDDPIVESRRRTDRFSTYLLLAVGLLSVLTTVPSLLDLPGMLTQAYSQFGIGEYSNASLGHTIGWIILVIYAGLWVTALLVSLRRLAARKTTWWVPFTIGVIANVVYMILLTVAMVNDPAFMQYVNGLTG